MSSALEQNARLALKVPDVASESGYAEHKLEPADVDTQDRASESAYATGGSLTNSSYRPKQDPAAPPPAGEEVPAPPKDPPPAAKKSGLFGFGTQRKDSVIGEGGGWKSTIGYGPSKNTAPPVPKVMSKEDRNYCRQMRSLLLKKWTSKSI